MQSLQYYAELLLAKEKKNGICIYSSKGQKGPRGREMFCFSLLLKAGRYRKLFVHFMAGKAFISTFIIALNTAPCDRHLL